jgi:hypothetical protein
MKKIFPLVVLTSILTACGGGGGGTGGGGGAVSGLEMPANLSVVASQNGSSGGARMLSNRALYNDAGTDYSTDVAQVSIYDASMESLQTVNMILCVMGQTRATEMVNQGAYIALVNEDKCDTGGNESSGGSGGAQSTGSGASDQTAKFNKWTINSTRADNSSPQIVKIWVPGEANASEPMDGQDILVEVTVNEGVSATRPFGSFVLNFVGVVDPSALGLPPGNLITTMTGTLQSVDNTQGQPQFQFINLAGNAANSMISQFTMMQKANVVLDDASSTGGVAHTSDYEGFDQDMSGTIDPSESRQTDFAVAFNAANFLRGIDDDGISGIDSTVCTSRTDLNEHVWRYNLYHGADGTFNDNDVTGGQLVELDSGFPFTYSDGFGYVGYWGVWTEDGGTLADNTQITKQTFGSSVAAEDYTVNVSPGKLWRRTRETSSFANFVGMELSWWGDPADPFCQSGCMSQGDHRVTVQDDGMGGYNVVATDSLTWGDNGPELTPLSSVADITPTNTWDQLWMNSDALGGSVVVKTAEVVFFKEEVVSPSETGLSGITLTCFERCPRGDIASDASAETDLFHDLDSTAGVNIFNPEANGIATSRTYTLTVANGKITLADDTLSGQSVGVPASVDWTVFAEDWYQWGVQSGDMVTAVNIPSNWYEVSDATTTYRWETGTNNWNQNVSVTGTGGIVNFDKPIQMTYQYVLGDDPNGDNFTAGTTFLLEYGGPGELWGFPWEDADGDGRWYSALTLKDGVTLTDGTNSFRVRGMEKEQTMSDVALSNCSTLDVDNVLSTLSLPTAVSGTPSFAWGDKPTVTDAPAVIEGELQ